MSMKLIDAVVKFESILHVLHVHIISCRKGMNCLAMKMLECLVFLPIIPGMAHHAASAFNGKCS